MYKIFYNLILLVSIVFIHSTSAQNKEKSTPKTVLTILGDKNVPPPAPLIYRAPEKSELKEFTSEDTAFQITFPGVPKTSEQEISNGNVTNYRVYRQGSNSIVNTIDYNFELESNMEKIYETVKANLLKVPKSTVEAEKDIKVDGKVGKEFNVLQDYQFQKIRILIVGKRIYEIRSDVTNWHILSKYNKEKVVDFENETERFFSSFKLNKSLEINVSGVPKDFIGVATESSYKNTFFNFSFDYPKDWHRLGEEEIAGNIKSVAEIYRKLDERNNKAFQESLQNEVVIFAVSQRNETIGKGSNLSIGVIKQPDSQATSRDIALATKKLVLLNPKSRVAKDIEKIQINGTPLSTATFQTENNGQLINQKIVVIIRKGYSVAFVMTYRNEEGLNSLEKIIETLKFSPK